MKKTEAKVQIPDLNLKITAQNKDNTAQIKSQIITELSPKVNQPDNKVEISNSN